MDEKGDCFGKSKAKKQFDGKEAKISKEKPKTIQNCLIILHRNKLNFKTTNQPWCCIH